MIYSAFGILFGALFFLSLLTSARAADVSGQKVTIYRDIYGVPHIDGDSEAAAAAFG